MGFTDCDVITEQKRESSNGHSHRHQNSAEETRNSVMSSLVHFPNWRIGTRGGETLTVSKRSTKSFA